MHGDISLRPRADNMSVRQIVIASGLVTTLGRFGGSPEDGRPTDLAADDAGNLYYSDWTRIMKLTLASGAVTTLAGDEGGAVTGVDGVGPAAHFSW